jgi:hypothetical protein
MNEKMISPLGENNKEGRKLNKTSVACRIFCRAVLICLCTHEINFNKILLKCQSISFDAFKQSLVCRGAI